MGPRFEDIPDDYMASFMDGSVNPKDDGAHWAATDIYPGVATFGVQRDKDDLSNGPNSMW